MEELSDPARMAISIHALLAESDYLTNYHFTGIFIFLSTLSLRRATDRRNLANNLMAFLSTLSLRRATFDSGTFVPAEKFLSTLSLRRATIGLLRRLMNSIDFYPRSPCGERRKEVTMADFDKIFLSTLSLRRATVCWTGMQSGTLHFYPRSPCGERRIEADKICKFPIISIHALLAESDPIIEHDLNNTNISIHALLAESDIIPCNFVSIIWIFLSTLSLRRATCECWTAPNRQ